MSAPYQKQQLTIDSVSWTPITALFNCNNVVVRNLGTASVKIRTTSTDPLTEDTIYQSDQEINEGGSRGGMAGMAFRFPNGFVWAYAQAVSGTGPLMVTCTE